jgi:hypothetical protein
MRRVAPATPFAALSESPCILEATPHRRERRKSIRVFFARQQKKASRLRWVREIDQSASCGAEIARASRPLWRRHPFATLRAGSARASLGFAKAWVKPREGSPSPPAAPLPRPHGERERRPARGFFRWCSPLRFGYY